MKLGTLRPGGTSFRKKPRPEGRRDLCGKKTSRDLTFLADYLLFGFLASRIPLAGWPPSEVGGELELVLPRERKSTREGDRGLSTKALKGHGLLAGGALWILDWVLAPLLTSGGWNLVVPPPGPSSSLRVGGALPPLPLCVPLRLATVSPLTPPVLHTLARWVPYFLAGYGCLFFLPRGRGHQKVFQAKARRQHPRKI